MLSLTRAAAVLVVLCAWWGCAPAPSLRADALATDADSTGTIWGDEYDGLPIDALEPVGAMPSGFRAEWVEGTTRRARLDAFAHGAGVHARSDPTGEVGSVTWRGTGYLREIVAGDFTPAVAEGALVGDPRTGGDLRAPASMREQGLGMRPSASSWSSMTGAGVVLGRESLRLALGGWQAHDEPLVRVAAASVERRTRGATLGIAGGAAMDGAPARDRGAVSLYAARDDGTSFASGELAMAEGRMRAVTRFVAGERREWSAIAIAGAGPAVDEPLVFTRRERWGAALERRDGWSWGASRAGVSSLLRRDALSEIRRRRAFWDGEWRVRDDTRFELAARVTREDSDRGATGPLATIPARATSDDWRARATLRARHTNDQGWVMDNAYRIEWVQNRSGRPGTLVMWTWRLRAGAFDGRFSASAHALQREQVAYVAESTPLDTGDYSAMTGKGAALTASLRLWLRRHAWLEAAWAERSPAASRVWVSLGLRG